jgi:hypothetical protein
MRELTNGTGVSTIGWFSFDPHIPGIQAIARETLRIQERMQDPEIVIPINVDESESYWQQVQSAFNLWGIPPGQILNQSRSLLNAYYLAADLGIVHTKIAEWYLNNIL